MLPPRTMTVAGTAVAVMGVLTYGFLIPKTLTPLVVGVALGAAIVIGGHVGGGPRPVPTEGYPFQEAMALIRRATVGALVVSGVLTALAFYLWALDTFDAFQVLLVFAVSLLLVYVSVLAATGLIHTVNTTATEPRAPAEGDHGEQPPSPREDAEPGTEPP